MKANNYGEINSIDNNDINTQYKNKNNNFYNSQTNFYNRGSLNNFYNIKITNNNSFTDMNTIFFNYKNNTAKLNQNYNSENNNFLCKTTNDYKGPYSNSINNFSYLNHNASLKEFSLFPYNTNTTRNNNNLGEINEFIIKDKNERIREEINFNEENKNDNEEKYNLKEKLKKNKSAKNINNNFNRKVGNKMLNNNALEEEVCKNDFFDLFYYNKMVKNKFNINDNLYNNSNDKNTNNETNKKINYNSKNYENNNENFEGRNSGNINYNNINIGINNNNFIIGDSIAKAYQTHSGSFRPNKIEENSNLKNILSNKIIELDTKEINLDNNSNINKRNKSSNSKYIFKTEGNEKKLIKRNNSININNFINSNTEKYVVSNIVVEGHNSKYEPSLSEKNINNYFINNTNKYFENAKLNNNKENYNGNCLRNIYIKKNIRNNKKINECFNEIEELNSKKNNKNIISSNKVYISKNNFIKTEYTINKSKINYNSYKNNSGFHKNLENIKNRVTDLLDVYSSLLNNKIFEINENMKNY